MQQPHIFNHVDLRVRDRDRAIRFYDALLGALGLVKRPGEIEFVSYGFPGDAGLAQWFGFTVDPAMQPGQTRISPNASSRTVVDRLAEVARTAGALHCEPPHEAYGPDYYATFFEDPDGNKLEVAYVEVPLSRL
jgi:catechol 2,3-dioxygenase-like lactoylglutathione lyase family enzyme